MILQGRDRFTPCIEVVVYVSGAAAIDLPDTPRAQLFLFTLTESRHP